VPKVTAAMVIARLMLLSIRITLPFGFGWLLVDHLLPDASKRRRGVGQQKLGVPLGLCSPPWYSLGLGQLAKVVRSDIAGTDIEDITGAVIFSNGLARYPDASTSIGAAAFEHDSFQLVSGKPERRA
jgi:hypothetical protein